MKKIKMTAAAKRKRTNPHEASKTKLAVQDLEGGEIWTWQLEPHEIISVAGNLPKCILFIRNHGPDPVGVYLGYGDQQDVMPDGSLLTVTYGKITIEAKGFSARVEMQVMPTSL